MAKKIMVYLKDEDLNILGKDVTGKEIVNWAMHYLVNEKKKDPVEIEKAKKFVDLIESAEILIKENELTEKQLALAKREIKSILDTVTYKGFCTGGVCEGEDGTYDFKNLCPWVQGSLREYIKEGVRNGLKSGVFDVDFSMFKF